MTESSPVGFEQAVKLISDGYERKARLYPALLIVMPVAVVTCCGVGSSLTIVKLLLGIIVACGGLLLLSQVARDAGKRKEHMLFDRWGGMPSVCICRHSDDTVDGITKSRYHQRMAVMVPGTRVLSREEELADPTAADQIYTAWSTFIRVNTRDTKKYPLLFQENISYGYRRNVWGMKPVGVTVTAVSLASAALWACYAYKTTGSISLELIISGAVCAILLLLWIFHFTAEWVRIPANAYAERLVEAIDSLPVKDAKK